MLHRALRASRGRGVLGSLELGRSSLGALGMRHALLRPICFSKPIFDASEPERHTFQAETRQLLDIVTNALYTDRHIFVRELISNASDALEKFRHVEVAGELSGGEGGAGGEDLQIELFVREKEGRLVIADNGVGMSREELVSNLGTIARSGTRAHLEEAKQSAGAGAGELAHNLIGMFGVGFYSAFMVAEEVVVTTRAAGADEGVMWKSKGDGEYEITGAGSDVPRGTSIELKLKPDAREFANAATLRAVIEQFSTFVSFPILLEGERVNSVQALWTKSPSSISDDEYDEFFRFKTKRAFGDPQMRLHFTSDAPIDLRALFFVGEMHDEDFGLSRMKRGVDLYSRRVLIEPESTILPDWLRFVQGVVDSEDLPLNISRESMQDSALLGRLRNVLTRRFLRFLAAELKRDRTAYERFFQTFGVFLKEGACSDPLYQQDLSRLMLYESTALPAGELTTLDEYIARMPPGQDKLYFLIAPHRGLALRSPYLEAFKPEPGSDQPEHEVLLGYSAIDDFVLSSLRQFNGRDIVSAESSNLGNLPSSKSEPKPDDDSQTPTSSSSTSTTSSTPLTSRQVVDLGELFVDALPDRLKEVKASSRLRSTPAVVVDHESAPMRRMMRMMAASDGSKGVGFEDEALPKQTLEINPAHPVIKALWELRDGQPAVARAVAQQVFDNALVAAGLLDDPRSMLPRLNSILEAVLQGAKGDSVATVFGETDPDFQGIADRFVSEKEIETRAQQSIVEEAIKDEKLAQDIVQGEGMTIDHDAQEHRTIKVKPPKAGE